MSLLAHPTLAQPRQPLFHKTGLVYFWFLNDHCEPEHQRKQLEAYAKAGVAAICFHPRSGLLLPYGGGEWFDMIQRLTRQSADLGMQVWLYDEDPYPSGNAGGRLIMDRPELQGRAIEMDQADPAKCTDNLFAFGQGTVLWCGILDANDQPVKDLTASVGVVRRRWEVLDPWDSRWYYPATPLYPCPRSLNYDPELCVTLPKLGEGEKLVAFTARPAGKRSLWGGIVDTLNPVATQAYIEMTHERYKDAVGEYFGSTITAMFTDEAKFHAQRPWTGDLATAFQNKYGYDLRPRLIDLFSDVQNDQAHLTRLHYRLLCGQRFIDAWMKPVSQWCADNDLKFIGHISPEDDPIEQNSCVTNLMPIQHHLHLPGLDIIIPAVGDKRHPLISMGVVIALSIQQQLGREGVVSELLGANGLEISKATAGRIIRWQTIMGVTTPVIHGGFSSIEGHRRIDAPPDSGPLSPIWDDMIDIGRTLAPVQEVIRGSTHIAPVAILYPIRSFNIISELWQGEPGGLRGDLIDLLALCLDHQIGVHFVDEADFWNSRISQGNLQVGQAVYQHLLIPSCTLLHERTLQLLENYKESGLNVMAVGDLPARQQTQTGLAKVDMAWCPQQPAAQAVQTLPRLIDLPGDATDIRCSAWLKDGKVTRLVMNLREERYVVTVNGQTLSIEPGEIEILS